MVLKCQHTAVLSSKFRILQMNGGGRVVGLGWSGLVFFSRTSVYSDLIDMLAAKVETWTLSLQ